MIVEFAGPSAVGKSSISKELAIRLAEQGTDAWVEPKPGSAWTRVRARDVAASYRYARALGLGWKDGLAREVIDLAVAQAALKQHRSLEGVVLSQGVARDLWLSCRRHDVSDEQRARAMEHLELPDAVVLLNVPDDERRKRSTERGRVRSGVRFSKKRMYRMVVPEKDKTISVDDSLAILERALGRNHVPTLYLMNDGTVTEGASRVLDFLSGLDGAGF